MRDLRRAWSADVAAMPADAAVKDALFSDLIARHKAPDRRYHGVSHLRSLCALLSAYAPGAPPAARLAIWWHDAIYDPTRKDNEEKSADLARAHLSRLGADGPLIEDVCALILATKDHLDPRSLGAGDAFIDADFAILGAPSARYAIYTQNVRAEYAMFSDDAFAAGRAAFLKRALAAPRLFKTDAFNEAFAAQARANMTRELQRLMSAT